MVQKLFVNYPFLFISLVLFSVLFLPFLWSIPYLDGNIDFVKSYDFYTGGIDQYLHNWQSVHPPLKYVITNLLYTLSGIRPISFNLVGYFFGVTGIVAMFFLTKQIFNKQIANTSTLLLSTCPMYLAVGIFSLVDYLVAVFMLIILYFYSKRMYFVCAIAGSCGVFVKETALILPLCIVVIEIASVFKSYFKKKKLRFTKASLLFLPIVVSFAWYLFLNINGKKPWGDWIFAETADKGSIYTIFYNITTLHFINNYAFQHWKQLFFLNFNWVYWGIIISGVLITIIQSRTKVVKELFLLEHAKSKTMLAIVIFFMLYIVTVLSFQTYTIPRYALPVIPFILIAVSVCLHKVFLLGRPVYTPLSILIFISLFFSFDPVSQKMWGTTKIFGQKVYALPNSLAGNDGITYNVQYLFIVKKRTEAIVKAQRFVISNQCSWIFPDPNNDYKMMKILHVANLDPALPCRP